MLPLAYPIIRPLRDDDGSAALSLGSTDLQPLKTFLRRHARDYERESVARTYVVVDRAHEQSGGRVWGYMSLVASEVHLDAGNAPQVGRWPEDYAQPAVKLARMAIDRQLQGRGVGQHLIHTAIALIQDHVAPRIGCRLLVTDAKRGAVGFYERVGFTLLDTEANRNSPHPVMFRLLRRGR